MQKFMPISGESELNNTQDWQKEALIEAQKLALEEAKQKRLENG